ncbi:glycosyltransferase [Altibacter lentus]|uniref:glycosyltransferase n=1 Tax=Altibacter lentus TaxID=1223410 RepID=UPI000553CF77|nr:glycosyltransferase [Altibacter lentus]
MKVLHITTSSRGGAGIAAWRLHTALRSQGIASAFLAKDTCVNFEGETVADPFFAYHRASLSKRILRKLGHWVYPTEGHLLEANLRDRKQLLQYEQLSLPFSKFELQEHPLVQEADVLNLHWVTGILDYERFFGVNTKPLVWTLHDRNPFSGLFHYKRDETLNAPRIPRLEARVRVQKRKAVAQIAKGAIVAPSQWLLEAAHDSGVFDHIPLQKCIANAVDPLFFAESKADDTRHSLGIDPDAFVVLLVAGSLDIPRKGIQIFIDALEALPQLSLTVLTVGKGSLELTHEAHTVHSLGMISSPETLRDYYRAANVFVLPSTEDNLPNVLLEAMACGTPVISFAVGGMKEHVIHKSTGRRAKKVSAKSLAKEIEKMYGEHDGYDAKTVQAYAKAHFDPVQQGQRYYNLYQKLVSAS